MDKTNYVVVLQVSKLLPMDDGGKDGEFMSFQKVYPVINGKKHFEMMAYRFMRLNKNGTMKSQRGQAQAKDRKIFRELEDEMQRKESPTVLAS